MTNRDDPPFLLLILLAAAAWLAWWYWKQRETPEARARRLAEEARRREEEERVRREIEQERGAVLEKVVPPEIQRAMREFLQAGSFFGEEHSPLAYVGYRVGKTNGLSSWDRQRRLKACFQIEIPRELAAKYQGWGRPATYQRFRSMCQHLMMLADMRRQRRNFEHAVADWEADEQWFQTEFSDMADRLRRHGFST